MVPFIDILKEDTSRSIQGHLKIIQRSLINKAVHLVIEKYSEVLKLKETDDLALEEFSES